MRALEIFAGTQSISRALEEKGWAVDALDVVEAFNPTFLPDCMDLDVESIAPGTCDCIHASPPCTQFSRAKTTGVRDLEGADALVQRTLECIRRLEPKFWTPENPGSGLLRSRSYMSEVPLVASLDYCKYGAPYTKPTMFLGVMPETFQGKQCKYDCMSRLENATSTRLREQNFRGTSSTAFLLPSAQK
jgi:hypothetical protein